MKQRPRIYYSESQKALMWDRWQRGDSLRQIAQLRWATGPQFKQDRTRVKWNLDSRPEWLQETASGLLAFSCAQVHVTLTHGNTPVTV